MVPTSEKIDKPGSTGKVEAESCQGLAYPRQYNARSQLRFRIGIYIVNTLRSPGGREGTRVLRSLGAAPAECSRYRLKVPGVGRRVAPPACPGNSELHLIQRRGR